MRGGGAVGGGGMDIEKRLSVEDRVEGGPEKEAVEKEAVSVRPGIFIFVLTNEQHTERRKRKEKD